MTRRLPTLIAVLLLLAMGPAADALTVSGPVSWYGGPCDSGDNNRPAYGPSNNVPGIAMRVGPARAWYVLHLRARRVVVVRSDYGPASWTGRNIDVNWSAAVALGYRAPGGCVQGFPTGAWARVESLALGLRYPGCTAEHRRAVLLLRRRAGPLGAPGNCLHGAARVRAMQGFQRRHGAPGGARHRTLNLTTWRALYAAR